MKRKMVLMSVLLVLFSIVFVSCPGPESPSGGAGGDGLPPVPGKQVWTPFHNYDEFLSFYRGCWHCINNDYGDDYYRWISAGTEKERYLSKGLLYEYDIYEPVITNLSRAGAQALPEGSRGKDYYAVSRGADFPYEDVFDDEKDVDIGLCYTGDSNYYFIIFTDARPYEGTGSLDGYCYKLSSGNWWIKVSNDPDYDPSAGSGSGGGQGGSLDAYLGTYTFGSATGSQTNGFLSISGGSWSFEGKAGASNTITPCSASMDGSNVKLTYTMSGVPQELEEVFTVTVNGSSATWHCVTSGGYAASQSVIFSSVFGVIGTDMTFDYSE